AGTFTQTDGIAFFSHTLSSYKIGKYLVTYELWYSVYQWAVANGYSFANEGAEGATGNIGTPPSSAKYMPVTTINWRDAIVWCNAYSAKTGLLPVYYADSSLISAIKSSVSGSYGSSINNSPGSFDNPYVNWGANGYRLPSEGEYQYAAGYIDGVNWTPYDYASGATDDTSDISATELVAWFTNDSGNVPQFVGTKNPNALGIYDMSGNEWEWCFDWAGAYPGASTNYRGPATGTAREIRSGNLTEDSANMQIGARSGFNPYTPDAGGSFRVARTY
ncbi:MAG: SUMF1/EgtB/PvdO family nonheme iron enzyme, partial [Candidatus Goldiibacteriota bacterium]